MSVTLNASTSSGLVHAADTSGTIELQSNGTTKLTVSSAGAYGQLVSATAQTASSTAVDFTGIPSWVKRITVMFSGVSLSGTSNPLIQLGTSGGIVNTGYISTSIGVSNASTTAGVTATDGFVVRSNVATNTASGHILITNVSGNVWVSSINIKASTTQASFGGGDVTLSDTLTQIRVTTVNGTDTFDAGTINILYEG
jgi:hypothetical protein